MKKLLIIIFIFLFIVLGVLGYSYYNIKPSIELNGKDNITIKVNDKYEDEGAKAYIGKKDVSSSITTTNNLDTSKVGTYNIEYTIKLNYLKNKKKVIRTIKVVDEEAPTIELKGEETVTIIEGEQYVETGYNARDEHDGDITKSVVVENNVDSTKPGNYEVTYKVTDSSGNESVIKRRVTVKSKPAPVVVNSNSNKTSNSIANKKSNTTNTKVTEKVGTSGTGRGVAILMYHYFYDKNVKTNETINSNYMEIHDFESQMKYLHDNNYYFPTWQEVADFVDGKITLPEKSIVVTCDDGHASFFNLAIPVLNKYNIKATSFIITSKPSAKKIPKYKSENIIFESHTHDMHRGGCTGGHGGLFRCISYDKGLADLKASQAVTGSSDALAYPYGDVTPNVLAITRASGFKVAVTTKYGKAQKGMDKLQLPRIRMNRGTSLAGFKASI